jgi:hypothetical protein
MTRIITGAEAEALIKSQIEAHGGGIANALAAFAPEESFHTWLDTIRAIEEFINLPRFGLGDDQPLAEAILNLRLLPPDPNALAQIRLALMAKFGDRFAERFVRTAIQASAIGAAFWKTGADANDYFQSRRRHLTALLYAMPTLCHGRGALHSLDTLNQLLPVVEHSGITITGLHEKLMLAKVYPDFSLEVDATGFRANHNYEPLDALHLEPERASIVEMITAGASHDVTEAPEPVDPRLIFSAAELRNNIRLIEAAYGEFDLQATPFGPVAQLVRDCLAFCQDDYLVPVPVHSLAQLAARNGVPSATQDEMVHRGGDFIACTNAIAPFIALGETCFSTVTLLGRFLYYWKSTCLNRIRRFQIRSGFIFEENVKAALARQGFTVTDVKRINRKEFDVVATLGDVIYNLQCKNNLVDLGRLERDPALFARYNRQLDRSYARALAKEEGREALLKQKLGLKVVRHLVITRFPVATTDDRIIRFANFDGLREAIAA